MDSCVTTNGKYWTQQVKCYRRSYDPQEYIVVSTSSVTPKVHICHQFESQNCLKPSEGVICIVIEVVRRRMIIVSDSVCIHAVRTNNEAAVELAWTYLQNILARCVVSSTL